jgi:hypothetical protein
MKHLRRSAIVRFLILPFTLTLSVTACTRYRTVEHVAPYEMLKEDVPRRVTLIMTDGSRIVLRHPRVDGDSIFGIGTAYDERNIAIDDSVSIALAEIGHVEEQEQKPAYTILGWVLIPLVVVGLAVGGCCFSGL